MKLIWAAAGLALVTSAAAYAKDDDSDKDGEKKEKLICKTERVTGSRTRVNRTCMTSEQWDELAAQTKKNIDDYTNIQGGKVPADQNPLGGT